MIAPGSSSSSMRWAWSDWFLKQLQLTFTADRSAIMLLVRHPERDDTLMALSKFDGIMLQTPLADDAEQQLRQSLTS